MSSLAGKYVQSGGQHGEGNGRTIYPSPLFLADREPIIDKHREQIFLLTLSGPTGKGTQTRNPEIDAFERRRDTFGMSMLLGRLLKADWWKSSKTKQTATMPVALATADTEQSNHHFSLQLRRALGSTEDLCTLDRHIIESIRSGDFADIQELLGSSRISLPEYRTMSGAGLIHLVAASGSVSMLKLLLHMGFEVNQVTCEDRETPLHIAAACGRYQMVEALLEVPRIDDTLRDSQGRRAIEVAANSAIKSLMSNAQSRFIVAKVTQMHAAIDRRDPQILHRLFDSNRARVLVDPSTPNRGGKSILHRAARLGSVDLVRACLEVGANPLAKDSKGKMPAELCRDEECKKIFRNVPKMQSSYVIPATEDFNIRGNLHKWTNYASGYRTRWIVVADGILSYYQSHQEYPVNCKASIDLRFTTVHKIDRLHFEVRTDKNSLYFRAPNEAEASRWIMAIKHWEANRQQGTASQEDCSPAMDLLAGLGPNWGGYLRALALAQGCLNELEGRLIQSQQPTNESEVAGSESSNRELLQTLRDFLRLCEKHEAVWHRLIAEERRQSEMSGEDCNKSDGSGTLHNKLREKILNDWSPSIGDVARSDEYYDALEEAEAMTVLNLDDPDSVIEIIPTPSIETLVEPQIAEHAVPPKDIKWVEESLAGYDAIRRQKIPCESTKIPPMSIWNIVKNAIGKDLTRIPIPVNFSEPISMLQRICEDVEYADLLYLASVAEDPLMRLQYVLAFAVSSYSSSDNRIAKPFNPILGETFEYVSHEHGFRYVSEQVSHHPPISACHCESARFVYYGEVNAKTKFWGKSLELVPDGVNHVHLKDTDEHFTYKKVTTAVYNIIIGKMWLDHHGPMQVTNHKTGDYAEVELKQTGWRTTEPKKVEGNVYDAAGNLRYRIEGFWNRFLRSENMISGEIIELWRRRPLPPWSSSMYNFTYYAMTLNEITPAIRARICPTDSRLRPDQRAMEDGHYENANKLKIQLEEKQREQRRNWESMPDFVYKPRWFTRDIDPYTKEEYWRYLGGYWEDRTSGEWTGIRHIYLEETSENSQLAALSESGDADGLCSESRSGHTEEPDNASGREPNIDFTEEKYDGAPNGSTTSHMGIC